MPSPRHSATSKKQPTIASALKGHPSRFYAIALLAFYWYLTTVSLIENATNTEDNAFLVSFEILAVGLWLVIQMARVLLGSFRLDDAWSVVKEFGWSLAVTNAILSAISGSIETTGAYFFGAEMTAGTPISTIAGADIWQTAVDGLPPFLRRLQIQRMMLIAALIRTFMCAIGWAELDG